MGQLQVRLDERVGLEGSGRSDWAWSQFGGGGLWRGAWKNIGDEQQYVLIFS